MGRWSLLLRDMMERILAGCSQSHTNPASIKNPLEASIWLAFSGVWARAKTFFLAIWILFLNLWNLFRDWRWTSGGDKKVEVLDVCPRSQSWLTHFISLGYDFVLIGQLYYHSYLYVYKSSKGLTRWWHIFSKSWEFIACVINGWFLNCSWS